MHSNPSIPRNPLTRFSRWLGWTQNSYLRFGGWFLTLVALLAAVAISYSSLYFLAVRVLGFDPLIGWSYPLTIDALVGACYVTLWQLAAVRRVGWHRTYILMLGLVAAVLTVAGNALHGPLVHGQIPNPLPWWAELIGSSVPALTLVGAGHSMYIMLAVRRTELSTIAAAAGNGGATAVSAAPQTARNLARNSARNLAVSSARNPNGGRPPAHQPPPNLDDVIADMLARGEQITGTALAQRLGVGESTARRYLQQRRAVPQGRS